MGKRIVMEKHRKYTIILTIDGEFLKVKPKKDVGIGSEISYKVLTSIFFQSHKHVGYIVIACMLLLFAMSFYLFAGQNTVDRELIHAYYTN